MNETELACKKMSDNVTEYWTIYIDGKKRFQDDKKEKKLVDFLEQAYIIFKIIKVQHFEI